jgi:hypothetical protein
MKELTKLLFLCMMVLGLATMSCTKEGPQGVPGKDGIDGVDGVNGQDGADGNGTCLQCHKNDAEIFLKMTQFQHSKHYTGGKEHVGYGNYSGGSCSMCHTHQGYMTAGEAGNNVGGIHKEASPMSCYTCHQIHKTYTRDDYEMNFTDAIDPLLNENAMFSDLVIDIKEYGGEKTTSNTCAKCHQPRHRSSDQPDPTIDGNITITSSHFGPHYGTQGAIFSGFGGYNGTATPTTPSTHKGKHSCKSCHVTFHALTGNYGDYVGGHAMGLRHAPTNTNPEGKVETDACVECHTTNSVNVNLGEIMAQTEAYLHTLAEALMDQGIMDAEGHIIPGTMTQKQAAAYWNYALLHYDGSHGIHNAMYANELITAGLSYLNALP